MKDSYPRLDQFVDDAVVTPELQPEYLPGLEPLSGYDIARAILRAPGSGARRASVAIIHHESGWRLTFGELDRESSRLASGLIARGLKPGDRVAFRTPNRPEGLIAALATWKAGGIVVPTPLQARAAELNYLLIDTRARFLIAHGDQQQLAAVHDGIDGTDVETVVVPSRTPSAKFSSWERLIADGAGDGEIDVQPDPNAPAIIWHTGGTTGLPKACYHTHRRFLLGGWAIGAATGVQPQERWAASAPIGHALGFIVHTIYTLLHGAAVVLIEKFHRPDVVLRAIETHDIGTFTAITATWARMKDELEANPELPVPSRLHRAYAMWQSASSSAVYDWWKQHGIELMNNFGSTAFATWVLTPRQGERFAPAALGRPLEGYEVIAVDPEASEIVPVAPGSPGRMAVRGPTGLTYWNRPDLQARDVRDGWTMIDDLIRFDAAGNAEYLGRTDFLISTAGYKVAPVEVENVLASDPAVAEVAVVGLPDPIRRQMVAAFIALVEGVVPCDELKRHLQDRVKRTLAPYKYPRRIEFVDALPRDAVGKVQQRLLVETYSESATTPTKLANSSRAPA
jgi:2-aminobenzoate-CoA ligase